jgi:hypothetical protein
LRCVENGQCGQVYFLRLDKGFRAVEIGSLIDSTVIGVLLGEVAVISVSAALLVVSIRSSVGSVAEGESGVVGQSKSGIEGELLDNKACVCIFK